MFPALHAMFEVQYTELAMAVDVIAERIRALGSPAPATFSEFTALSAVGEEPGVPEATDMLKVLTVGHRTAAESAMAVTEAAEAAGYIATADLATQRIEAHEKTAWMLDATM